tara:strand:- start:933 stop:1979 length:1047 start_codon:yes stop_codon:yes gene_type:complete
MKYLLSLINNFKRTKTWYNLLFFLIHPLYNLIWQFIINFHGKLLYYLWFFKKRQKFDLKDNFSLVVKSDPEFVKLANLISYQYPASKIEYIANERKKSILKKKNISDELSNFKFNINDEISLELKEKILSFVLSQKNLSTAANYLKVFPTISLISLHINTPVHGNVERGSMIWHKDDYGFKGLDLFLAINDINYDNGPLYFLREYNQLGSFSKIEEVIHNARAGERNKVDIDVFSKYYPESKVGVLTGNSGDALFIDSISTYHRGGYCKLHNRLMLRVTYQTPDNTRSSVVESEFLQGYSTDKLKKDLFTNYAIFKKNNKFLRLMGLNKFLIFIYKVLHFKISKKNIF